MKAGFSLSLPRPARAVAIGATGEVIFVADAEVVRSLTPQGNENWGRRLRVGALQELRLCKRGLGVRGVSGAVLLDREGRVVETVADWKASCPSIKGSASVDREITFVLRSAGLSLTAAPSGELTLEPLRR